MTLFKAYLTKRYISVLKARQIYVSYATALYVLWFAMFHRGANVLLYSKGEKEAFELLAKCYRLYGQLPNFLRKLAKEPPSKEELVFPLMDNSTIRALPSTTTAGIGMTASMVVFDEHDEHFYAGAHFDAVFPTIERSKGQFISVFTSISTNPQTLAKNIFNGSDLRENINGFTGLFFPFDCVPDRDEKWYEETKNNISTDELFGLTPELYMHRQYPRDIDEALSPPQTSLAFDRKVINEMMDDCRNPVNKESWGDIDPDVCHIYKDYHIGNFYIAATDVSLGVGKDFNVTAIMDIKTGEIVADILSQYLAPELLAFHSVELLRRYHSPLWWIESNLWGRTVIKKALELGYKRLGYKGDKNPSPPYTDEDISKFGFTTEEKSRGDLFGLLIPAINDYQIKMYNQQGLSQFYGIIRNAAKNGRIEAMSSKHDDYPVAVGICWLKKGDVRTIAFESKPIETLHFARA